MVNHTHPLTDIIHLQYRKTSITATMKRSNSGMQTPKIRGIL